VVTVPPAAVIFSRAEAEKACAVTRNAAVTSPVPRILTSSPELSAHDILHHRVTIGPEAEYDKGFPEDPVLRVKREDLQC